MQLPQTTSKENFIRYCEIAEMNKKDIEVWFQSIEKKNKKSSKVWKNTYKPNKISEEIKQHYDSELCDKKGGFMVTSYVMQVRREF